MGRKTVLLSGLFGVFFVVCNLALTQTHGWLRIVAGAGAYLGLFGLVAYTRVTRDDLGLGRINMRRGLWLGAIASAIVLAALVVAFLVSPDTFRDERYHQGIWQALTYALLLVPFQTVLFEELLFRGLIWGYVRRVGNARTATHVSSGLFGLWHIAPSFAMNAAAISVGGIGIHRGVLMVGTVLVTYGAGVVLCELRRRSDSLLAPIMVHWTINGASTLLAALVWHAS